MKAWRRAGERGDLHLHHLQNYMKKEPKGPKPPGGKSKPPPRWRSAGMLKVAELVKKHGPELRKLLRLDVPAEEVLSAVEELELRTEECADLSEQIEEKNAELVRVKAGKRVAATRLQRHVRAKRAWKQAQLDLLAARLATFKAAIKEKAAKELAELGERQNEKLAIEYEDEVTRLKAGTAKARARARDAADDAALSQKRLRRAQLAEDKYKRLREEFDRLGQELKDGAATPERDEEEPASKKGRRGADGRFAAAPWELSPLIWAQLGRRTAPSAISANITDALAAFAPDKLVPLPCKREMKRKRGELAIAGEAMAAFRFAKAKRIMCFAHDESTKFGLGCLSTNAQIEQADGSVVDVVLRGATLTAGGTAEKIAASIEKKLFVHGRSLLAGWKAEHEKLFGDGSWAANGGADAESIGLHRLSENTLLMSDTCNGARATKRLLAAMAELEGQKKIGTEAWESMSKEEQDAKCKSHLGDCHQHLRNIIIKGMTLKATEILQLKLEDDLADLSPFDRTSVDIMDLIRAIFKELHAGGEYAKGKGREFHAWLKKHYPSAMWLPFERALGSRMDLSFDGCVPIFWNRTIILEFLNSLLVPGADNKLETYLWRALSCNEMVAHLRVCTLFQIIISEPMRWLAGKASKSLTDWSIVNSSEVLELAEAAFKTIAADGHSLLDPSLDPFAAIAAKQPLFAAWRAAEEQQTIKAFDGTVHKCNRVLAEARSPKGAGNALATEMVVELAEDMAKAALDVMHCSRRAIADKLTSQDGINAPSNSNSAAVHAATKAAHVINDLVESNFGSLDSVMRTCTSALL